MGAAQTHWVWTRPCAALPRQRVCSRKTGLAANPATTLESNDKGVCNSNGAATDVCKTGGVAGSPAMREGFGHTHLASPSTESDFRFCNFRWKHFNSRLYSLSFFRSQRCQLKSAPSHKNQRTNLTMKYSESTLQESCPKPPLCSTWQLGIDICTCYSNHGGPSEKGKGNGQLYTFVDALLSCLMIAFGCGGLLDSGCSSFQLNLLGMGS